MQALWHAEDANLGLSRAKRLVAGGFWQEPRFGEDRRNAQCATKLLLCLRELQSAAAAETRRTKAQNTGILSAAFKLIRDSTFTVAFLLNSQKPSCGEPRFGEHCYRHDAQCAKKPLLCLQEPQIAAAAET
ncbi:unnamed protein product [Coccothraustes coccothraustes]